MEKLPLRYGEGIEEDDDGFTYPALDVILEQGRAVEFFREFTVPSTIMIGGVQVN